MSVYDVIVIGSGHNALITAAYVARAGRSVLVLEKNDRPGGFLRTEELTLPGFQHDVYAAAHPLFVTGPAYSDLGEELGKRGLRYLNTDIPTGVSMEDGQTAVMSRSMDEFIQEADRLAAGDGVVLAKLFEDFQHYAGDIFSLFQLDLTSSQATKTIRKLMYEPKKAHFSSFSSSLLSTARQAVSAFRSPVMRAMIGPWVTHLGRTPDEVGSGIWVPLTAAALMGGGMPIPEGGSERLAQSLAQYVTDLGGTIHVQSDVDQIIVKQKRAVGVITRDGEEYRAKQAVVASTSPDRLYLSLLRHANIRPVVMEQARQYRYGRGCVQIHLALSEPPQWPDSRFQRIGQPHLTDGLDGCTLAIAQAMADLLPTKPTFTVDCSSNLDPSRAPAGKAVMRIQVLEVPCRPRGDAAGEIEVGDGTWNSDMTERFTERILGIVGKHIPNIPSSVIGKHVITPDQIAGFNPNTGPGDPYGGAHDLAQSYLMRPLPAQPSHQTEIPNLYMLGAATWPGHGINGGSGYIVAQKLLGR